MPRKQVFWTIKSVNHKAKGIKGISRTPAIPVLHLPLIDRDFSIVYDSIGDEVLVVESDDPVVINLEDYDATSEDAEFDGDTPIRPAQEEEPA